jgi:hypothetical protein
MKYSKENEGWQEKRIEKKIIFSLDILHALCHNTLTIGMNPIPNQPKPNENQIV